MKKIISIIILLILNYCCTGNIYAQPKDEAFTIYLVRHSEKDYKSKNYSNLPLSKCGKIRSEKLSEFLSDIKIDVVYSTNFLRTNSTALPTANSKELKIIEYSPENLKKFSEYLLDLKQDALVVGHSDTTAVLAGLLAGLNLEAFENDVYDRIYQVVVYKDKSSLNIFHSMFECN